MNKEFYQFNKTSFTYNDEDENTNNVETKLYTENDLREAFRAGILKGSHNSYFDAPLDEDEYIESIQPKEEKEEIINVPYFWIKNNIGWSKFCDITGGNHYAIKEFGEPTWDLEVTTTQAKNMGYIK